MSETREARKDLGDAAERRVAAAWLARGWPFVRHSLPDSALDRLRASEETRDLYRLVRHRPDFVTTTHATYGLVHVDVKSSPWVEKRELVAHEQLVLAGWAVLYVVASVDDPARWSLFWHPGPNCAALRFALAKSEAASGDVGWTPEPSTLLRFEDYWPRRKP